MLGGGQFPSPGETARPENALLLFARRPPFDFLPWAPLCVPSVRSDGLPVGFTIRIHGSRDVLEGWNDALHNGDASLLKSQRSRSGKNDGSDQS